MLNFLSDSFPGNFTGGNHPGGNLPGWQLTYGCIFQVATFQSNDNFPGGNQPQVAIFRVEICLVPVNWINFSFLHNNKINTLINDIFNHFFAREILIEEGHFRCTPSPFLSIYIPVYIFPLKKKTPQNTDTANFNIFLRNLKKRTFWVDEYIMCEKASLCTHSHSGGSLKNKVYDTGRLKMEVKR